MPIIMTMLMMMIDDNVNDDVHDGENDDDHDDGDDDDNNDYDNDDDDDDAGTNSPGRLDQILRLSDILWRTADHQLVLLGVEAAGKVVVGSGGGVEVPRALSEGDTLGGDLEPLVIRTTVTFTKLSTGISVSVEQC